ncbi:hypothetical protein SLS64_008124 [Diaporthe eres]
MRASGRCIKAKAEKILDRMRRKRPAAGVNNTTSGSFTPTKDEGSSYVQAGKTGHPTGKDTPDSRSKITPGPPIKSNDEAGQSTASQLSSDAQAVDKTGNISPVQAEGRLDLWKEALDKLPEEQQRRISSLVTSGKPAEVPQGATASDVSVLVAVTRARQEECEKKSWRNKLVPGSADKIVLGGLAGQVISWLTKAGDIGMEFAPTIAQQVWPCVKAILKIPVREAEQMAALLSVADKVARVTTRGRVYERCFFKASGLPADVLEALHEDLVALYKACLELLAEAIGLLDKNCFQKTVHSILHPDAMMKEAGSDFSDLESRLSQSVEMASAEISKDLLIQIRKLDTPIARIDEGVSKVLKSTDEKEERKIYKWISPVLVWDHHRSVAEKRMDAGAGKTFLTSKVIDDISDKGKLLDNGPHDGALAFFYFSRNDNSRNSGLACLRSLVRQLFTRASYPGKILTRMKTLYDGCISKGQSLSRDLCEAQLVKSMDLFSRITIVLDALDECNEDDRDGLVKTLTSLMGNSSRSLRVFISSRPDEQIREEFNDQASLEVHELLKFSSPDEVRERLGKLPRDLKETYDDIYKRQVTGHSEFATRVANRAIMWVMAADEPLTSGQLLSAVRINPVKYVETMDQIPNSFSSAGYVTSISENADYIDVHDEVDEEQLLESCANLLTWSPKDGVWALAHASVADYFEDHYFSRVQAATYTGTVCLAMVMDFYRSVTARRPLGAAMCLKMMKDGQGLEELLSTAEVGHESPLIHHEFIDAEHEDLNEKEYASFAMVAYGLFHLLQSWWQVPPASEGGEHNQAHADEDPAIWIDTTVQDDEGFTLLHLACLIGHPAIVKTLLALGADANKEFEGRTSLSLACEQDHDENLQIITTLIREARFGDTDVLRALLSAGADPNRSIKRRNLGIEPELPGSPLVAAAAANQVGALRVLIEEGHADPNMFIHDVFDRCTAAIWAAYEHRLDALEYLIRNGHVDPNAPVPEARRLKTVAIAAIAGAQHPVD